MAFSPFRAFRKHQKAFMIMLAIVCMIIFVFSFGEGDLFSRRFGSDRERGEVVVKVHGDEIYEGDIHETRARRQVASMFLMELMLEARTEAFLSVLQKRADLDAITGPLHASVQTALMQYRNLFLQHERAFLSSDPNQQAQARQEFAFSFLQPDSVGEYEDLRRRLDELRAGQLEETLKPEQSQAVLDLMRLIQYDLWKSDRQRNQARYFFGGDGSLENIIDFIIWKYQADRLNINLDEPSVIRLVNHTANRNLLSAEQFADEERVKRFLGILSDDQRQGIDTPQELLQALTDEFRVLTVKQAYLGTPAGGLAARGLERTAASAIQPTPLDFLDFFRENRTTRQISVLELPVKNFLDEVAQSPSTRELEELFEAYKDVEPNPQSRTPGFKEPRRIRLEYVIAKENSPRYKDRAKAALKTQRVWANGLPLPAGGAFPSAVNLALPWAVDLRLQANYQQYLESSARDAESWVQPFNFHRIHDQSWLRPGPTVMLTGQAVSASLLAGNGPTVAASWIASASIYEEAERQRILASYLPAVVQTVRAVSTPQGFGGVGSAIPTLPLLMETKVVKPEPLPPSEVAWMLTDREEEQMRRAIRDADLKDLAEAIRNLRSGKDEEARRAELKKLLEERGLLDEFKSMDVAKDRYALAEDPILETPREMFESGGRFMQMFFQGGALPPIEAIFLQGSGTYDPKPLDSMLPEQIRTFVPTEMGSVLWWLREEYRARVPASLNEAQSRVEAAWRYMRAQELARKKAEEIQKQVQQWKKSQSPGATVQNLREEPKGTVFDLRDVSLLVLDQTAVTTRTTYTRYTPPRDKIEFPVPQTTVKRLASLEEPGDAVVFWDQPQARFYVGVLLAKSVPTLEEFYTIYGDTPLSLDTLWSHHFIPRLNEDFEKKVVEQLRVEAEATDDSGRLVISDEIRKRLEERDLR